MIVTLSRQFAAGARTIAAELSRELGYPVLDQTLPGLVAQKLKVPEQVVVTLDEHLEPLAVRVLNSLAAAAPEASVLTVEGLSDVNANEVERVTHEIIADMAARESLIVVGRGGRWVVGNQPDAVNVRLVAPFSVRVERIMQKEGVNREQAEHLVRSTDHSRAAYIHRYFHTDWNNPENYHLVINTGLLSATEAADTVVQVVRWRQH